VQLPVLNSTVSVEALFLLAPIFALLVFVYLQLYLQRLKGLIHQLRAVYAQVEPRQLYPWVLTIADASGGQAGNRSSMGILRDHLIALVPGQGESDNECSPECVQTCESVQNETRVENIQR
jgi:hypothetical protein